MSEALEKKNSFSTVKDIRRLIGQPVVVEAAGLRLQLRPPSALVALEVRGKMLAGAKEEGERGGTILQAAALAVGSCLGLKSLSQEDLMQLVLRMGGEQGPLAEAALELCGLDYLIVRAQELAREQNPAPFS